MNKLTGYLRKPANLLRTTFLAVLLVALPLSAYSDDEPVEEVVVTAPTSTFSGSPYWIPPSPVGTPGPSHAEIQAFGEATRAACEAAKQSALAAGALAGGGAAASFSCARVPVAAGQAVCLMAVAAAIAACTY